MTAECRAVRARLLALRDPDYRKFQCRLMPTVAPERVLGVRMPALRGLAKELAGTPEAAAFLAALPHDFYDENNLHALLLMRTRGFAPTLAGVEAFLPEVDNWATCDLLRPRAFAAGGGELLAHIRGWLASPRCYTVRFGIGLLLSNYLGGGFCPQQAAWVADCCGEEYYVNMMVAWYFATALAKQWDAALPFLQEARLSRWVHNKTIRKACESYRVSDEHKALLRALRR